MAIFYTKSPTRAYNGATTQAAFVTLPAGQARQILDEVDGWLVYKEGNIFRFVRAEEVLYKPATTAPVEIHERLAALEAWARGIGFQS